MRNQGAEPLILTARLQHEAQLYFDGLRQRHFPPERNFIGAHVTLFHALPQANADAITLHLRDISRNQLPLEGWTSKLQSLGRGVAFVVECPQLVSLRASLAQLWHSELTPQDRQTPRLHITVQNKVAPETARALLEALDRDFEPRRLLFEGLELWRYLGGPWSPLKTFPFT